MNPIIEQLALTRVTRGAHDLVTRADIGSYMKIDGRPAPLLPQTITRRDVVAFCSDFGVDAEKLFKEGRTYRFAAQDDKQYGRVRVELACDIKGPSLRHRMLPGQPWSLEDVRLPDLVLDALEDAQRGLVIVTGQMNTAKSTIVDALINGIYVPDGRDVIMFQDPTETLHPSHLVCQYNVRSHPMNLRSWSEGNEHQVRSNAMVIVIGEVNDAETARCALRAAECGALVFITLHAGLTARSISRLLAQFDRGEQDLARTMLADCLVGVLGPRLVRRQEPRDDEPTRALAVEWLPNDPDVRLSILNNDTKALSDYLLTPPKDGLQPLLLEDELSNLADVGAISREDAERAANVRDHLFRRTGSRGIGGLR